MARKNPEEIISQTIADYNLIAEKFSSTRKNLSDDLLRLRQNIPPGTKVLDYGCGNGRMSSLFNREEYWGVDPSEKLIEIARLEHPGYRFEIIKPFTAPTGHFDAILCLAVIHHLPDEKSHRKLINLFSNLLPSNGLLLLTSWNLQDYESGPDKMVHIPFNASYTTIDRALYKFSQNELEELLKQSSFLVESIKTVPRNRGVYSNIEIIARKTT